MCMFQRQFFSISVLSLYVYMYIFVLPTIFSHSHMLCLTHSSAYQSTFYISQVHSLQYTQIHSHKAIVCLLSSSSEKKIHTLHKSYRQCIHLTLMPIHMRCMYRQLLYFCQFAGMAAIFNSLLSNIVQRN